MQFLKIENRMWRFSMLLRGLSGKWVAILAIPSIFYALSIGFYIFQGPYTFADSCKSIVFGLIVIFLCSASLFFCRQPQLGSLESVNGILTLSILLGGLVGIALEALLVILGIPINKLSYEDWIPKSTRPYVFWVLGIYLCAKYLKTKETL